MSGIGVVRDSADPFAERGALVDATSATPCNRDVDWDRFDPDRYYRDNYVRPLAVDVEIIRRVRDFFGVSDVRGATGLDVGAGSNLYPSLTMLPFCDEIELWEHGGANVAWLEHRLLNGYEPVWDVFWDELSSHSAYTALDPRATYAKRVSVVRGSVFDLAPGSYDIATMFFVACSISANLDEFEHAMIRFVGALRPGAPFAAAFMLGSTGYDVDGVQFPSVPLTQETLQRTFNGLTPHVNVEPVETKQLIRPGYTGMALATGRAGPA